MLRTRDNVFLTGYFFWGGYLLVPGIGEFEPNDWSDSGGNVARRSDYKQFNSVGASITLGFDSPSQTTEIWYCAPCKILNS